MFSRDISAVFELRGENLGPPPLRDCINDMFRGSLSFSEARDMRFGVDMVEILKSLRCFSSTRVISEFLYLCLVLRRVRLSFCSSSGFMSGGRFAIFLNIMSR